MPLFDTLAPTAAPETRPGYKLTKLGWIPEEWKMKTLKEVARMATGHTPSTKKPDYYGGDISWVSLQDTRKLDNFLIEETTISITDEGLRNCSAVLLPENTVILLRTGNVGKTAILSKSMAVSQDYVTWTCGPDLLPEFLYFTLQATKPLLERQANGSTVKTIGLPFFEKLQLILPPLPEQQRIAAILTTLDATLTATDRLLHAKRRYQQGLMQQLLTGQRRFPAFAGQAAEAVRLKSYLREVSVRSRSHATAEKVLSVTNDRGFVEQKDQFAREVASTDRSNYKLIRAGQFGYNPSRINVGSIALLDKYDTGLLSPVYTIFETVADKLDPLYLRYFFQTSSFQQQLKQQLQGSVRDILAFDGMGQLKLWIPPLPEQRCIAAVLTALAEELRLLGAQRAQWQRQKQGLLQALLTGAVRVKTN